MTNTGTDSDGDVGPIEFGLAVVAGTVGSALLSALMQDPWWSVGFALLVMGTLSGARWRIASVTKDHAGLESFAEDVYLLGYLLTLAALLGLAPRLMKDDNNLFHIAGVKLVTTVFGLGMMMIFRHTARRWAKASEEPDSAEFLKQEEIFRASVGRLNEVASQLAERTEAMALRFDPALLAPVGEWSNRAANAFSTAVRALDAVPTSIGAGVHSMEELNRRLDSAGSAATAFANTLKLEVSPAVEDFGNVIANNGKAVLPVTTALESLKTAAAKGSSALGELGTQTTEEVKRIEAINGGLRNVVTELVRLEESMERLCGLHKDKEGTFAPVDRLVEALKQSTEATGNSVALVEPLRAELREMVVAGRTSGVRLEGEIGKTGSAQIAAVDRVHQQFVAVATQIGEVVAGLNALENTTRNGTESATNRLVGELGDFKTLSKDLREELKNLGARIEQGRDGGTPRPILLDGIQSEISDVSK